LTCGECQTEGSKKKQFSFHEQGWVKVSYR